MFIGLGLTPFFTTQKLGIALLVLGVGLLLYSIFASQGSAPTSTAADRRQAWHELAKQFEQVPGFFWVEWYSEGHGFDGKPHGESWLFRAGSTQYEQQLKQCEALCQIAGSLLLRSSVGLSQKIRSRSNDAWRWLYYLKEKGNGRLSSTGTSTAHGFTVPTESWDIKEIGKISQLACLEISQKEI
jgi:hypothetical protein